MTTGCGRLGKRLGGRRSRRGVVLLVGALLVGSMGMLAACRSELGETCSADEDCEEGLRCDGGWRPGGGICQRQGCRPPLRPCEERCHFDQDFALHYAAAPRPLSPEEATAELAACRAWCSTLATWRAEVAAESD